MKHIALLIFTLSFSAFTSATSLPTPNLTTVEIKNSPLNIPAAPEVSADSYILIDAYSGRVLAENNSDTPHSPASLTKIMTTYVIADALENNRIALSDKVRISQKAWKTGGSKMFIKVGNEVSVENLVQGIVVTSGNDACVAMSEHIAGDENSFTDLMNQHAKLIGMQQTNFVDSTGLSDDNKSTARDLAILSRQFILKYPIEYEWFKQKWFLYNNIKQPNRNRLLWRNEYVDGIKTGHTTKAGYCLISSAKQDGMRLIAVVLGAPSEAKRATDSQRLLTYGFRFFETKKIYDAGKTLATPRVWRGDKKYIPVGVQTPLHVTVQMDQHDKVQILAEIPKTIQAPLRKGEVIGKVIVQFKGKEIATHPIVVLESASVGGIWAKIRDAISLPIHRLFNKE